MSTKQTHPKQPPKRKHKTTKKKKFLTTNMLILFIAVFAILLSVLLFVQNEELIDSNKELQKQIDLLKTQGLKNQEKLEKQEAKKFEEKLKDLTVEYTQHPQSKDKPKVESVKKEQKAKYFEEKLKDLEIEYTEHPDTQSYVQVPKEQKNLHTPIFTPPTGKKEEVVKPTKPVEKKIEKVVVQKPKLAIIIDDVTTSSQIKHIKNIGYNVNIAFLPPNKRHPNSAKIAKSLDYYMVHLPLQASNNRFDEAKTLHINDSVDKIEKRIQEISQIYPNSKFMNNHTGSKFTANKEAMERLFSVLKKYDYTFIDSRTTAKSYAKHAAKKYGVKLYSRNIFLDNNKDHKYIQKQLKKAVRIAKKTGLAIAIGHPYKSTFHTLKNSKDLLKDVEVVYVQNL